MFKVQACKTCKMGLAAACDCGPGHFFSINCLETYIQSCKLKIRDKPGYMYVYGLGFKPVSLVTTTVKILNIRTPQKIAVSTLKFEQDGFSKA